MFAGLATEDAALHHSLMTDAPPYRPEPELVAEQGPWGGPVYHHRGAEIRCHKGGHVCALFMDGHPLHGMTFGAPGTVAGLVDHWVEQGRLPSHMRKRGFRTLLAGA
jgi:hypothetical protein